MKKYERLEEAERILVVVDMVNGFIRKGRMSDPYIEHIIPEIEILIKEFLENNDAVFFIKDAHEKDCAEFKRFPKHCVKGTCEAELVSELKPYEKDALRVYEKNSTSLMFAPNFIEDLNKMENLKEVVGVGCCSDICVLNAFIPMKNYFDEQNKDVNIIVAENAIETYDAPNHNRDEYNDMAKNLLKQAGISLVKQYGRRGK